MSKIIDRTGKGSSISQAEFDANYDSLHGINKVISGATHTITIADQGDTIELTNSGTVAVTLDSIATILGAAHTSDFKVTLISVATGRVTITPNALDTINTGTATIFLYENEYVTIQSDSTNIIWNIIDSPILGLNSSFVELNYLAGSVVGTSVASKALVLGATKDIDTIDIAKDGLKIGAAQVTTTAAELNQLDGVGVGSFTPTIYGTTTAGTPTGTFTGTYFAFADWVFINIFISLTAIGGMSGSIRIGGLPFTIAAGQASPPALIGTLNNITIASNKTLAGRGQLGLTFINMLYHDLSNGTGATTLNSVHLANDSLISLSISYQK